MLDVVKGLLFCRGRFQFVIDEKEDSYTVYGSKYIYGCNISSYSYVIHLVSDENEKIIRRAYTCSKTGKYVPIEIFKNNDLKGFKRLLGKTRIKEEEVEDTMMKVNLLFKEENIDKIYTNVTNEYYYVDRIYGGKYESYRLDGLQRGEKVLFSQYEFNDLIECEPTEEQLEELENSVPKLRHNTKVLINSGEGIPSKIQSFVYNIYKSYYIYNNESTKYYTGEYLFDYKGKTYSISQNGNSIFIDNVSLVTNIEFDRKNHYSELYCMKNNNIILQAKDCSNTKNAYCGAKLKIEGAFGESEYIVVNNEFELGDRIVTDDSNYDYVLEVKEETIITINLGEISKESCSIVEKRTPMKEDEYELKTVLGKMVEYRVTKSLFSVDVFKPIDFKIDLEETKQKMIKLAKPEMIRTFLYSHAKLRGFSGEREEIQVDTILDRWATNKAYIFKLFGEKLTVEVEREVEFDEEELRAKLKTLCKGEFRYFDSLISSISISDYMEGYIEYDYEYCEFEFDEGTSVSKIINQIGKSEALNIELSKILQNKKSTVNLVLSIDPIDYLTQSINNSGWDSCHKIKTRENMSDGMYGQAVLSTMQDESTIVSYRRSSEKSELKIGDSKINMYSKMWRSLIFMDNNTLSYMQSRQYPFNNIQYTNIFHEVLCELSSNYGITYTTTDDIAEMLKNIEMIWSNHYNDIIKYGSQQTYRFRKSNKKMFNTIKTGHEVKCIHCGKRISGTNHIICDNCC